MEITPTEIREVLLIKPRLYEDERGFFMETYHQTLCDEVGITGPFVQDNHSRSARGVLRGLHYQIQQPQGKLVRVVRGEIYDVAVDLRRGSNTFGRWVGHRLSSKNKLQMWVPVGFAHGFYVLSDVADLIYKVTDYYAPVWDRTLRWDDPDLGILWPLSESGPPKLSEKDAQGAFLPDAELYE